MRKHDRFSRSTILGLCLVVCSGLAASAADTQLVVPDTPTQLGAIFVQQGQVAVYDPNTQTYSLDTTLIIPGSPPVDAVHKLSNPGQFLFSTEVPLALNNTPADPLALAVGSSVQWNDIVRYDGESGYSLFFCNLQVGTDALSPGSNIDAFYLDGGDDGDLVLSVDAATTLEGADYEQNDLLRFMRTGPGCGDWEFVACEFDASTLVGPDPRIPSNRNVVGVTKDGDQIFFALDTTADLAPSTYNPYKPSLGELATWNTTTASFTFNSAFNPWPVSPFPAAHANSLAAPPPSCTGLGSPNINDSIIDLCGAGWVTDAQVRRFRIEWLPLSGAAQYTVYRGVRSDLCSAGLAFATVATTFNTYFIELTDPPVGEVFMYLIEADNGTLACGNNGCGGGGCCARTLIAPGSCP